MGEVLSGQPVRADGSREGATTLLRVTLNGEPRELPAGTTVAELLALLGATGKPCAVEIDRVIVPRSAHATRSITAGNAIEVVSFVGGG
ncbi:MAG: sulfur carrier protein ThiS [Planctomycetota bacterium]